MANILTNMTIEELEEELAGILPSSFQIKNTKKGIIIYTSLIENEYGELVSLEDMGEGDDDDDESIFDAEMESLSDDLSDE